MSSPLWTAGIRTVWELPPGPPIASSVNMVRTDYAELMNAVSAYVIDTIMDKGPRVTELVITVSPPATEAS